CRVALPRTTVVFQVRSIEAQCTHSRREVFWKFARAMARHDLRHDFLLHKTPRPIAHRTFVIREEVFDGVVIERGHAVWGPVGSTLLCWLFPINKIDIAD